MLVGDSMTGTMFRQIRCLEEFINLVNYSSNFFGEKAYDSAWLAHFHRDYTSLDKNMKVNDSWYFDMKK